MGLTLVENIPLSTNPTDIAIVSENDPQNALLLVAARLDADDGNVPLLVEGLHGMLCSFSSFTTSSCCRS
jgi:hypothetical protein